MKSEVDRMEQENELLNSEIVDYKKKISVLEKESGSQSSARGLNQRDKDAGKLYSNQKLDEILQEKEMQLNQKDTELIALQTEVYNLNNELKVALQKQKSSEKALLDVGDMGGHGHSTVPSHIQHEMEELRSENKRMHEELDVLDADFFEEIENLKYNYSVCVKKVNQYEKKYGPLVDIHSGTNNSSNVYKKSR